MLAAGAAGQHAAGGAAVDVQAPGDGRQLPDAPALELPPPAAAPEHALLPGRVRRPHRHQADADRTGGARRVDDPGRHPGVRADLLRHHGGSGRRLRRLAAAALPRLGAVVHRRTALLRAAPGAHRQGSGRRALDDDRAHHRRLHQHRHRQAVLACRARVRLCAFGDAGVPGHGVCADAAGQRLRDRQPPARHRVDPGHRWRHAVAVDAGPGRRGRGGGGHRDVAAPERHLALGDVGDGQPVRAGRHGAGRHQHAVTAADGAGPPRRRAAAGAPRRAAIRRRQLPLRRQRRPVGRRPADAAGTAGREDRPGRPLRRGQEHDRQPAAALPRPGIGPHPDRRPGHRRRHAGQPAGADRHGDAGHLAAAPLGARQHPLRPTRCH